MSSDRSDPSLPRRSTRERTHIDSYRDTIPRPRRRRPTPVFTPTPPPQPDPTMSHTTTKEGAARTSYSPPAGPSGPEIVLEEPLPRGARRVPNRHGSAPPSTRHRTPFDTLRDDAHRRHLDPPSDDDDPMDDDERRRRRQGKRPARPSAPPSPPGGSPPPPPTPSARSVSAMISLQPGTHKDFELSLSDVNKAFADVGKLTGPETWPMWKFRVETALQTIVDFYASRANRTVPNEVMRAVFNVMTGHIGDTVMANYMNLGVQGRQAAYTIPKVIFVFVVILHITFDSLVYIHANIRKLTRITYILANGN